MTNKVQNLKSNFDTTNAAFVFMICVAMRLFKLANSSLKELCSGAAAAAK